MVNKLKNSPQVDESVACLMRRVFNARRKQVWPTVWLHLWLLPLVTHQAWAATAGVPPASSFYVPNLPGLHSANPPQVYAGHILSDPNAPSASNLDLLAHLFFVMVKARRVADKERLMFWFNGGPGCSSFDGLLMEVGSWRVDGQGGLKTIEGGWDEYVTMVYVDQPAGTGFSYTSTNHYVRTLQEATEHMIQFFRKFYQIFPEYLTVDTYLGGESFAGQYIPYFADAILRSDLNVPLRGAAIGNGWIDARNQYPAYLEYAVAHGFIDLKSQEYKDKKRATDQCLSQFDGAASEPIYIDGCEGLASFVLDSKTRIVNGVKICPNVYDLRLEDEYPACGMNWPPDVRDITSYLARRNVVEALHATGRFQSWVECLGLIWFEMRSMFSPSSIMLLPSVIERIPVLVFVGDKDFMCNYMGIKKMIDAMSWNGERGLGKAQAKLWTVAGTPAGTWVSSRNLTYVRVFNASHLAPYDVPGVTHDMILRFMGVDFSAITEGSAYTIPSSVGDDVKPVIANHQSFPASSESKKALWDAYYSVGVVSHVFLLFLVGLGACMWYRRYTRRVLPSRRGGDLEVSMSLHGENGGEIYSEEDVRKGE